MTGSGERSTEVDAYIARLRPHMQRIAAALRDVIVEAEPEIEETLRSGHPSYSLNGHVCDIFEPEDHVALGFWKGVGLADPAKLLYGTGKRYREARFRKVEDIKREELKALIGEAAKLNL